MGRPHDQQWKSRAQAARIVLKDVPDGQREQKLSQLAGQHDLNTVRRAIAALDFLDRWIVEEPEGAGVLAEAPQTVVEVIARWASFDRKGALAAASRWNAERTPVGKLNSEMKLSRASQGTKPGRTLKNEYRDRANEIVEELVGRVVTGKLTRPSKNYRTQDDPAVDFHFLAVDPAADFTVRSVACKIVGPYRNRELYRGRRLDALSKAFALAWVHDVVVLLLPDNQYLKTYQRWIDDFTRRSSGVRGGRNLGDRTPSVHVVTPLTEEEEAAIASLAT
jgi:hypothetical protein